MKLLKRMLLLVVLANLFLVSCKSVGTNKVENEPATNAVENDNNAVWEFSAFGLNVDTENDGYSGSFSDGEVEVYSKDKAGKLIPNSTDGLAFYYTKIDPKTTNFKLSADAEVKSWNFSNGQEGFGLMVCDRVGTNGDASTFWNNSYMASVTKVEYYWDGEKVSNKGDKITMKLGVGAQEKTGITQNNINAELRLNNMSVYNSKMTPLDISCAKNGVGTYNLVGNFTNAIAPIGTIPKPLTKFNLSIEKNNTGYFVSYTDPDGKTTTKKYYDADALVNLDKNFVYAGFFAARNVDVVFKNISFTTSNPETDKEAEEPEFNLIDPKYQVISSPYANRAEYILSYLANIDGKVSVKCDEKNVYDGRVEANKPLNIPVKLNSGENIFDITMTPYENYVPSKYEKLSSYEPVTITHKVDYSINDKDVVYVSPDGKDSNDGTKGNPISLVDAVKKAIPGQTIYLLEGEYKISERVIIDRGIDGLESSKINLFADPDAKTRPVLNFDKKGDGVLLAGNHWHLKGFDVTNTADMKYGIYVAGSYNVIELVNTYKNGNTGINISGYNNYDSREMWPAHNLIKNCTSMHNADNGLEDANGFAAKRACGVENIFDGCIAAFNADDGWDLYVDAATGSIESVTIQNCIAYKNGYALDKNGKEIKAGNGNGFKLGGESLSGYHKLVNSIAFANAERGIDSNYCQDIIVERCTSFNNGNNNIALYTNTALNTDFTINGAISYKKDNDVEDRINPIGKQDEKKIYNENNYYYINGKFENSANVEVKDDWFKSLDDKKAIDEGFTRNADGSINTNGFLELTENAPKGVGASFN